MALASGWPALPGCPPVESMEMPLATLSASVKVGEKCGELQRLFEKILVGWQASRGRENLGSQAYNGSTDFGLTKKYVHL